LSLISIQQPPIAQAASGEVKLGIRPVGQPGDYFDLTLRPGEGRDLQVDLGNLGDSTIQVRSYASDVYTIIDGGFGARLRDEPRTGMTMWLDYTTVLTDLAVGGSVRRGFSVRVPDDAAPGEYATSIIVENETPRPGSGTVRLDQINRQAVAVLVTVPGPRTPGLAIGAATHKMFNGTSMVSIAVRNTGNVRLKPVVGFTLFDPSGAEVRHGDLTMDTFYAHTDTLVEFPFDFTLPPGAYTVDLSLDDAAQDARSAVRGIPLVVAAEPPSTSAGSGPGLADVIRAADGVGIPLIGLAIVAGLLMGIFVCLVLLVVARRRRRPDSDR